MAHAAAKSTFGFAMARVSLGLGESGNFPAAIKTVAEWFPKRDRALATGIFNSGANIGAVVAPIMVPWILGAYGWQEAFIITGAIGFIWLVAWWFFYEIPRKKQGVTEEEIAYIESDEDEQEEKKSPVKYSWAELFGMKQTWVFIIGKFMTDPIWWFFLFWIPGYFANIFALDLKTPSLHLAFLYTCTTVGSIGGGYLSGYFIKKGHPIYKARKLAFLIIALCTLPIITIQWANDLWTVVLIISLAASAHQAWSANIFTTASDMFPQSALSSVVGIGGLAGAVGGVIFPAFIGIVLDYYKNIDALNTGYNVIFMVCGSAYLLALVMMHFILPKMNRVTAK
jgi:ACS family hexuronate transporter-like MFS transporter